MKRSAKPSSSTTSHGPGSAGFGSADRIPSQFCNATLRIADTAQNVASGYEFPCQQAMQDQVLLSAKAEPAPRPTVCMMSTITRIWLTRWYRLGRVVCFRLTRACAQFKIWHRTRASRARMSTTGSIQTEAAMGALAVHRTPSSAHLHPGLRMPLAMSRLMGKSLITWCATYALQQEHTFNEFTEHKLDRPIGITIGLAAAQRA